jgi:hypothetical protein
MTKKKTTKQKVSGYVVGYETKGENKQIVFVSHLFTLDEATIEKREFLPLQVIIYALIEVSQ